MTWTWLGRVRHGVALELQEDRRTRLLAGDASAAGLILCEHEPVITLGRSAPAGHLLVAPDELARRGIELARVNRGGEATYHGPGQLMVYPVVHLRRGVVAYLETLAGALAEVAAELGVPGAAWRRCPTGLWLDGRKLAACGLHVRRGVAVHGFAFNVTAEVEAPDSPWRLLVPCGMSAAQVTSLAAECARRGAPAPPPVAEVARRAAPRLGSALGLGPPLPES